MRDRSACVATFLQEQPSWSDLPLLVLTAAGIESPRKIAALQALGPMTLLKRPVQSSTLVSSVRSALRDRRRQYQARNHIVERERQAELLRAANDTLAFALEAGNLAPGSSTSKRATSPARRSANGTLACQMTRRLRTHASSNSFTRTTGPMSKRRSERRSSRGRNITSNIGTSGRMAPCTGFKSAGGRRAMGTVGQSAWPG